MLIYCGSIPTSLDIGSWATRFAVSTSRGTVHHRVRKSQRKRQMSSALFGSFRRLLCSTGEDCVTRYLLCREFSQTKLTQWAPYTIIEWKVPISSDDICLFLLDMLSLCVRPIEKESDRREGKGHRYWLGDICTWNAALDTYAPWWLKKRMNRRMDTYWNGCF